MNNHKSWSGSLEIIKLGGSLLKLDDWQLRITRWLATQPNRRRIWIVGGGELVDVIRVWGQRFELSDETAHLLACRAMGVTADLLAKIFPAWPKIKNIDELQTLDWGNESWNAVFDASDWTLSQPQIPATWDVASDSIAGYVAVATKALTGTDVRLTLLKSTLEPNVDLVDRHFGRIYQRQLISLGIQVRIVDLSVSPGERNAGFPEKPYIATLSLQN